jgi:hypothetical protein
MPACRRATELPLGATRTNTEPDDRTTAGMPTDSTPSEPAAYPKNRGRLDPVSVTRTPGRGIQNDGEQSYDAAPESGLCAQCANTERHDRMASADSKGSMQNGTSVYTYSERSTIARNSSADGGRGDTSPAMAHGPPSGSGSLRPGETSRPGTSLVANDTYKVERHSQLPGRLSQRHCTSGR